MKTCRPDVKGEAQVATPRGESTDAGHRDGLSRSSVEAPVMGVERRGQVIPSGSGGPTGIREEPPEPDKTIYHPEGPGVSGLQTGSGQQGLRRCG